MAAIRIVRRPRRPLRRLAVSIAIVVATLVVIVVFFEESMIFFPSRYPAGSWDIASLSARSGYAITDCSIPTEDGLTLHGWWCRPPMASSPPLLLFFHGNAGNLSDRADLVLRLAELPAEVVIVDYRGYGRSDGHPSEKGLYRDATAAWRFVLARGVSPARIVLFGKSLGGAVAIDLAARVKPAGLIAESSFTSIPDMAAYHYPIVPKALVRTRMDSLAKIPKIACPLLVIHSRSDEIVPFRMGQTLYQAAPEPKSWFELTGARHNDSYPLTSEAYLDAIRSFISSCVRSQ